MYPNNPYNTQYTPHAISSNWMVNSAFQWGTQAAGMQQSPGYVMGQRPSDTFFVAYGGSQRLQDSHQKLMRHVSILDALRAQGGDAEDLADKASDFGPMATAYLGQYNVVQQAMGGNIDAFSRRMVGGATSIAGGGTLSNYDVGGRPEGRSWRRQQAFHQEHLDRARSLGTAILNETYGVRDATGEFKRDKTGRVITDPFNANKDFTRGFQIEQVADVVNQLGYEGQVAWRDKHDKLRTNADNMASIDRRLGKLAAARNVFGDADVNTLQQKTESLLGSSLGANDDASREILQQISAEARVLNKDVDNMVKSREVIKNTLIAINKARDSRGVNLTYDGSGSVSGDLEVTANAVGSLVDHATKGLPQKVQEGMARNMTRTLVKDIDSDAGRMARLMQAAALSGEVSQEDYAAFMQGIRSGNTAGATRIARASIRDLDKVMSDQVLYENTISHMTRAGIDQLGSKEEFQKANKAYTEQRIDDIAQGAHHQHQTRYNQAAGRRMTENMRTMRKITGVKEDERTDAEKMADYRARIKGASKTYMKQELADLQHRLDTGDITQDEFDTMSANVRQAYEDDMAALDRIKADNLGELRGRIKSGKSGIAVERAGKYTDIADEGYRSGRYSRYMKKVADSGKLDSAVRLQMLEGTGQITGEQVDEIMAIEDKEERAARVKELQEKYFEGDEGVRKRFERDVENKRDQIRRKYIEKKPGSVTKGMVGSESEAAGKQSAADAVLRKREEAEATKEAKTDDAKAAEKLAQDKTNAEKVASGAAELIKAIKEGMQDNLEAYADGDALKVKIINPNDVKTEESLVKSGSGGK